MSLHKFLSDWSDAVNSATFEANTTIQSLSHNLKKIAEVHLGTETETTRIEEDIVEFVEQVVADAVANEVSKKEALMLFSFDIAEQVWGKSEISATNRDLISTVTRSGYDLYLDVISTIFDSV